MQLPSTRRINLHYIALQAGFWSIYAAVCAYHVSLLMVRGFTDAQIGIVLGVRCFAGVLIQPVMGSFADRHPNIPLKHIVALCLLLSLGAQAAYMVLPLQMLGTLLVYTVIGGLELSAYPFLDAMAVEYINAGVPLNYSLGRGIGSFFYACTCVFLGFQVTAFGAESSMITHCVLIILVLALVLTFPTFHGSAAAAEQAAAPSGALTLLRRNKKFTLALLASFFGIAAVLPMVMYMIRIIEPIGGTDAGMGIALFVMGAAELPAAMIFSRLQTRMSSHKLLVMSLFFCLVKIALFAITPNMTLFVSIQLVQMLGYGIFTPASVFFVNETVPHEDKVKGQSLMMAFSNGMGGTVGSFVGGWALDFGGVPFMLGVMLTLGAIAVALGVVSLRIGD